jgi:hypothetical protein
MISAISLPMPGYGGAATTLRGLPARQRCARDKRIRVGVVPGRHPGFPGPLFPASGSEGVATGGQGCRQGPSRWAAVRRRTAAVACRGYGNGLRTPRTRTLLTRRTVVS